MTFENSTFPPSGARTPCPERPSSGWLVDKLAHHRDGNARFVILVDEFRHLHQRPGHPLRQHQERKQRSDVNRIVGRERKVDADRERAVHRQSLQRPHPGLHQIGHHAFGETQLRHPRDMHIPGVSLAGIERQRFNRAGAE